MMILVSGGAGSGKSACAESICLSFLNCKRIYLATMQVWGEEDRARVRRHRLLRQGKGFETVERPTGLTGADVPQGGVVLLEDLTNLTANECFGGVGFDRAEEVILSGIREISCKAEVLVIVTGELCSDGITYPAETSRYLALLSRLNRTLAAEADTVVETAAGFPILWKGQLP